MDRLPLELLHWVCESFEEIEDLQNFRLVNRAFAAVGAEYLVPQINFFLHEESLNRLKAISEHPLISRSVECLLYEGNIYDDPMKSFDEWESEVDLRSWRDIDYIFATGAKDDERATRHVRRALDKIYQNPRHELSNVELQKHYRIYRNLWRQQKRLEHTSQDLTFIADAMKRFPQLKDVVMSSGFWFAKKSRAIERTFREGLSHLGGSGEHNANP